jgi:hypothetical protein
MRRILNRRIAYDAKRDRSRALVEPALAIAPKLEAAIGGRDRIRASARQ